MMHRLLPASAFALAVLATCLPAAGQSTTAVRATELRSDKLGSAGVLTSLPAGAALRVLGLEGGWAWVESAGVRGWVRANALNLQSGSSVASGVDSGRQAAGNTALTLGTRSLPPRSNRHALIIGIGRYGDPGISPLPGVRVDKESATQMAQSMQVPASNITYLHDEQATGDNIRAALKALDSRVQDGDRVFIHYSGHGTRSNDAESGGCVEALLAYEGNYNALLTNREVAGLLKPITNKTDKLFVMYDACHSGGIVSNASTVRTRGIGMAGNRTDPLGNGNDDGLLRAKVTGLSEDCSRPVNVKTRNLTVESVSAGALPQDIIHVSAARENEISFDDEFKGGLATQFMRDCMLRDAKDLDGSGAVDMNEIRQCAQEKINKRMQNDANYKPHNITLTGNTGFVPAWFAQASQTPVLAALPVPVPAVPTAALPPVAVPVAPTPVAVAPAPAELTGEQALRQMFNQRDAKRSVQVSLAKGQLKIGQDALELAVQSDRPGYVYVAMIGSDSKSMYLLFPNDLDQNNKIEAGRKLSLPRPNWRVRASGPAGTNNLLVMVADGPRDLAQVQAKAGPFVTSLNDASGRAKLGALMTASGPAGSQSCQSAAGRKNNPLCSDAFGATMISVEEVK
ncbi:MAG: caspase family protein [Pseudomonadota bacterium]